MKNALTLLVSIILSLNSWASEIFIQTEIPTTYTITIGDQSVTNSTGKFRFFDLSAGLHTINVFNTNTNDLILSKELALGNNTRTVVFISSIGNAIVQGSYTLVTKEWYDSYLLNNSSSIAGNGSLNRNFEDFIATLQATHTEARKLEMAKDYVGSTYLTADHVEIILKTFDFDSNRIQFAIFAYDRLTDPQNYFVWKEAFDFRNNYLKVEKAIKAKR